MPRDNKKRGRRGESKRKLDEQDSTEQESPNKRVRLGEDSEAYNEPNQEHDHENVDMQEDGSAEGFFYGLLDEQEAEYFRRADEMLEIDQFETPEERNLFLSNIFKEAEGKELKMACSQSCSRLLEKLILSSPPDLLKKLFRSFSGQ